MLLMIIIPRFLDDEKCSYTIEPFGIVKKMKQIYMYKQASHFQLKNKCNILHITIHFLDIR